MQTYASIFREAQPVNTDEWLSGARDSPAFRLHIDLLDEEQLQGLLYGSPIYF
mgnify:CR=1 FL=1